MVLKCGICDNTIKVVNIQQKEFTNIREKIQAIANSEEKHSDWLQFMCLKCRLKLEELWEFMISCRNAYSVFLDETMEVPEQLKDEPTDYYVEEDEVDEIAVEEVEIEKYGENEEQNDVKDASEENYIGQDAYKIYLKDVEPQSSSNKSDHLYSCQQNDLKDMEVVEEQEIEILQTEDFGNFSTEFFSIEEDTSADATNEDADPECQNTGFKQRTKKKSEYKSMNPNPNGYKCLLCKKIYSAVSGVRAHISRMHLNIKPYMCKVCGKMETHLSKLRDHESSHDKVARFECDICGKKLTKMMALKRHKETIHFEEMRMDVKPYICIYCGEDLKESAVYYEHLKQAHGDMKMYKCRYCLTKKFFRFLEIHEKTHTEARPFECEFCMMKFKTAKAQAKHEALHKDAPRFACEYCGKSFTTSSNCRIHKRIHTGETPYGCPTCPKRFYDKKMCKKHSDKCPEAAEGAS